MTALGTCSRPTYHLAEAEAARAEADALRKPTLTFTQSLQAGIGGLRARVIDPNVSHKCATHFAVKPSRLSAATN